MITEFESKHWNDADGNPAGGCSFGPGFCISWQHGPLGRGEARKEPNGAFVETIIAVARHRLEYYQAEKFASPETERAINFLNEAIRALNDRTRRREAAGTEGTHEGR